METFRVNDFVFAGRWLFDTLLRVFDRVLLPQHLEMPATIESLFQIDLQIADQASASGQCPVREVANAIRPGLRASMAFGLPLTVPH